MSLSSDSTDGPRISVVVPVYGCDACLTQLVARLQRTLTALTPRFEIILVDDRSPDSSWPAIERLSAENEQVHGLRLSRNFGQHVAITAGLAAARGDYAVVMDCDLQDPPELIADLYARLREGYDLVLARRTARAHASARLVSARLYFALMSRLTEERIDGSYGTLSMLSRKVIDAFLQFSERERHYLFVLRWLGFHAGTIEYTHQQRTIGESSYTFSRLLRHALDGLFFQSTVLLRWIVTLGLAFAAIGLLLAVYFVLHYLTRGSVAGWTSVVVLLLTCTGVILTSLGVTGLYIGKIFEQTKQRPLYVVDRVLERRATW